MPDAVELALTLPPELGPADGVLAELRERVRVVELERAAERHGRRARPVAQSPYVIQRSYKTQDVTPKPCAGPECEV